MFSAPSVCVFVYRCVCLFVCQHENFRTSKHRMMKPGVAAFVQKSRPSSGGRPTMNCQCPWVRTPKMWRRATPLRKSVQAVFYYMPKGYTVSSSKITFWAKFYLETQGHVIRPPANFWHPLTNGRKMTPKKPHFVNCFVSNKRIVSPTSRRADDCREM